LEAHAVTAQEIVARIQKQLAGQGVVWREGGRDTYKAGRPETEVRGIATSGMSTFDVLRRAAADGKNLVITHEPTFYNDRDVTTTLESDPVYIAKQRFIAEHDLVIWRFHDHAHAMKPDPLVAGSARTLGWTQYASPTEPRIYILPATTLGELARDVARRLGDHAIRIVGDPAMKVSRVILGPGYGIPALTADVDVTVGGEIGESGGNTEYALDAASAGQPKGMIMLGHMMSEDHGMQEVADWLRTFLSDVPIAFVPAGIPFSNISA
jgi:putative NIF3 family GTP cyclohydrolase 1 type 2